MLSSSKWFLILVICALETKQTLSVKRDPKSFVDLPELTPARLWSFASTPNRIHHNYDFDPSNAYTHTQFSISNFLKKILGWKTKPYYKPYYQPFIFSKPVKTTTTTTTTTSAPVLPCECGIANPTRKIVGGEETGVNQYPWVVALCNSSPCNSESQFCGGTLINDYYVMTAAHCLDTNIGNPGGVVFVSLGDHDLSTDAETSSIEMQAQEQIFFPGYTPSEFINDLALIKLPSRITITDNIRPICLPLDDTNTYAGDFAIVTGWGRTSDGGPKSEVLRGVSVAVLNNAACSTRTPHPVFGDIPPTQICSGGMGENSCNGDSGGSMITEIGDNKFEQIGIVSYGDDCDVHPGVYTRITKYLDWIRETTEGALYCASK